MGIACFQLNIFALTQQKNRINKQLMTISDERDMVTTRLNKLIANSEGGWYKDPNVKLLQSQDNNLDSEQKSIETQLKDIEAKLEAFEKQKENNIKKETGSERGLFLF